jgi:SAM-dependent methyltransferase
MPEPEIAPDIALATNRAGWNQVAPLFHGGTALPEYGPLAATEDTLGLLDPVPASRVLELGCGSGHSLHYLAERGALELWGVDLSPVQIAFAEETLRSFAPRVRLIESPMEVNPGLPQNHFDLVLYGLGWTTDLRATMALVNGYLRPGGCLWSAASIRSTAASSGTEHTTRSQRRTSRRVHASTRPGRVCPL